MSTQRFHANVSINLHLLVESPSRDDAELTARRMACRPGIRQDNITGVTVTAMTLAEQMRADNLVTWQESEALRRGDVSQRQRWLSGCLPELELLALARDELFRPFTFLPRRRQKHFSSIPHPGSACHWGQDNETFIDWQTTDVSDISAQAWQQLTAVHTAALEMGRHAWLQASPSAVSVNVREHKGTCRRCTRSTADQSALVTVAWGGRTLSREYAL